MRLLQIIPNPPEVNCGVGDYARLLARTLDAEFGIHSEFLVPLPPGSSSLAASEKSQPQVHFTPRSALHFLSWLEASASKFDAVLLQFSPYGYQKRGIPFWLSSALHSHLARHPGRVFTTMFHELYATGRVTTSAFWLGALQKHIVRRLARLSQHRFTNRQAYAVWLSAATPGHTSPVTTMPVFSNLGECPHTLRPSSRPPVMTMFHAGIRSEVDWQALQTHCAAAGITAMNLIGRKGRSYAPPDFPIEVTDHGYLTSSQISPLLEASRIGYLDYYPGYLGKSGIFAAYAAHGVPVILRQDSPVPQEGLQPGVHHVPLRGAPSTPQVLDQISSNCLEWYTTHNLHSTASRYAAALLAP